jgi:hypothetical protein
MELSRPDELGIERMDFNHPDRSFSGARVQDLTRVEISVTNLEAGRRVLDQLRRDGFVTEEGSLGESGGRYTARVGGHQVSIHIGVVASLPSQSQARPLSRVETARHGYEMAWNHMGYWQQPAGENGMIPILRGDQVSVLEVRGDLPAPQGLFARTGGDVARIIDDPRASQRLTGMIRILQAIHDRCPPADRRRAIINEALLRVRTELGESTSGSASIPHLWMTLGRAIVEVGAYEQALPNGIRERTRVLPQVLSIQREVPIEHHVQRYTATPDNPNEYNIAEANDAWVYRWSEADAAVARP